MLVFIGLLGVLGYFGYSLGVDLANKELQRIKQVERDTNMLHPSDDPLYDQVMYTNDGTSLLEATLKNLRANDPNIAFTNNEPDIQYKLLLHPHVRDFS
jgi:hypothetical protein